MKRSFRPHVEERDRPSSIEIRWTADGRKAGLLINGYMHAVSDFATTRGYSRSNLPVDSHWSTAGHGWDDNALTGLQ